MRYSPRESAILNRNVIEALAQHAIHVSRCARPYRGHHRPWRPTERP